MGPIGGICRGIYNTTVLTVSCGHGLTQRHMKLMATTESFEKVLTKCA
jgi:hypothetical protein